MRVSFEYLAENGSHAVRRGEVIAFRKLAEQPLTNTTRKRSKVPASVREQSTYILLLKDDSAGGTPRQFYSARIRRLRRETFVHRAVNWLANKLPMLTVEV